ncbi:hypothetical protein [Streptomyces viridochromogenes]|uniref:hypothetical protein n=1 Tax=Streptomyces viridochromogenes TaxID=1938 RepID=UPI0031DA39C8
MPPTRRRQRKPLGWDLFGEPYYTDPNATPEPPSLPVFTSLPDHLSTRKQIRQEGLEPVGRPVGLLSWTPQGYNSPIERPVWDIRQAEKPMPREPDIFELMEQEQEQD